MKILLLSPTPNLLTPIIQSTGDEILLPDGFGGPAPRADAAISYNYKRIIPQSELLLYPHINLHISLLPHNRGADPNFWSHFDHTPKGVSIHYMDEHLDTGPILAQREPSPFGGKLTLRSTYDDLHADILRLFDDKWRWLRTLPDGIPQTGPSSYHRSADKDLFFKHLPLGWDTPVSEIEEMGMAHHASSSFWRKYYDEIDNIRATS